MDKNIELVPEINHELINTDLINTELINTDLVNKKKFYVYFIESNISKCTYIGATVDLDHRLRQHNKEISGGAHATSSKVAKGEKWYMICYVSEFPTWNEALKFEWRWKQLTRKISNKSPKIRRFKALNTLLNLYQSTSKAVPFKEWLIPPKINFSDCNDEELYNKII